MGIKPPPGCTLTERMFDTLGWFSTRHPVSMDKLHSRYEHLAKRSLMERVIKLKEQGLVRATHPGRGAGWLLTPEGFATYKQEFEARYG